MVVDIHVHIGSFPSLEFSGEFLRTRADVVSFRSRHPRRYARIAEEEPYDNSPRLLEAMDRRGIDRALIQSRPGVSNELVSRIADGSGGRLFALVVPTPWPVPGAGKRDGDRAAARVAATEAVDRAARDPVVKGVGELYVAALTQEVDPVRIADDLACVAEPASRYGFPVEIPTAWTQFPGGLVYGDPLWVDELAGRHPDVPFVLTKMGRGLTRFFEASLCVALRNANVYLDVSDTTPEHLRLALDQLGPERIMYGSDWSATWQFLEVPADVHTAALDTVAQAGLGEVEQEMVLHGNAVRVFRLTGTAAGGAS